MLLEHGAEALRAVESGMPNDAFERVVEACTLYSVRAAALINGAASNAAEAADIYKHAIYPPGCPDDLAALAVARHRGASGLQFLRVPTTGYEVSTRIGAAMGRAHYRHWHNTGTVGTFGAAAAAGVLLGLDEKGMVHALLPRPPSLRPAYSRPS